MGATSGHRGNVTFEDIDDVAITRWQLTSQRTFRPITPLGIGTVQLALETFSWRATIRGLIRLGINPVVFDSKTVKLTLETEDATNDRFVGHGWVHVFDVVTDMNDMVRYTAVILSTGLSTTETLTWTTT